MGKWKPPIENFPFSFADKKGNVTPSHVPLVGEPYGAGLAQADEVELLSNPE
jgi:hypothetical protein